MQKNKVNKYRIHHITINDIFDRNIFKWLCELILNGSNFPEVVGFHSLYRSMENIYFFKNRFEPFQNYEAIER